MTYRYDIQALRALAVGLVVLYHFRIAGFAGGFVGVDIFFVISGYLMTAIVVTRLVDGSFSLLGFLAARALRIWPALAVLAVVLLVLGMWLLPPMDLRDLARQARSALDFTSNLFFDRGQGYFQIRPDERWLLHTWSLSVEWQFYLLYPIVLLGAAKLAPRLGWAGPAGLRSAMLASLMLLALVSVAANAWLAQTSTTGAFFALGSRVWQFAAGGLVFFAQARVQAMPAGWSRALRWGAAGLLIAVLWRAYAPSLEGRWPGPWTMLPVAAGMLVILAGCGAASPTPSGALHAAVAALGRWSYSIYLWHWPVMVALRFSAIDRPYPVASAIGGIALSVVLGALSYRMVESAFHGERAARSSRRRRLAIAGVAMLGAYALAQTVAATHGLASRVADNAAFYAEHEAVAREHIYPPECSNFKRGDQPFTACSLNPEITEGRVLVIGDSHAEHFHAWFALQEGVGTDFFTAAGCPLARRFNLQDAGYRCHDYTEEAWRRARDPRYRLVVISNRWNRWDTDPPTICRWRDGRCRRSDRETLRAAGLVQERHDVLALLELGREIVMVDDTPEAPFNVPRMRMRQRFLGIPVADSIDEPVAGPDSYFERLWRSVAGHPRLHRVDFRAQLCQQGRCRIAEADTGRPILVDHGHFSPPWIAVHGDPLRPHVVPAAAQPPSR